MCWAGCTVITGADVMEPADPHKVPRAISARCFQLPEHTACELFFCQRGREAHQTLGSPPLHAPPPTPAPHVMRRRLLDRSRETSNPQLLHCRSSIVFASLTRLPQSCVPRYQGLHPPTFDPPNTRYLPTYIVCTTQHLCICPSKAASCLGRTALVSWRNGPSSHLLSPPAGGSWQCPGPGL